MCHVSVGISQPEMNREPGPAKPTCREFIEEDRLYDILSDVRWTQPESDENEDSEMAEKDETERRLRLGTLSMAWSRSLTPAPPQ